MRKSFVFVALVMIMAMLAACSGAGGEVLDGDPLPAAEPTEAVEPTPQVDPAPTDAPVTGADACPTASEGTLLYVNEANGYCFLYPATFTLNDQDQVTNDLFLSGKPLESDKTMEPLIAWMWVNTINKPGAAGNVVLTDYVNEKIAKLGGIAAEVTTEQTTIAGVPAIVAQGPIGRGPSRVAYLIANNTLYEIHNEPIGDMFAPEIVADSDLVWQTVTGSLTFFDVPDPDMVTAEEVCPQAAAGQKVFINREAGYCFLIGEDWQEDQQMPGILFGGPEIPSLPDFVLPAKHVSIGIGFNGYTDGKSLEQIAQERVDANPSTTSLSETDLTFGGYPAVIMLDSTENLGQRIALIDVNDILYSILIKPTNAEAYPESQPTANDTWNLVTSTLQFFEPWN